MKWWEEPDRHRYLSRGQSGVLIVLDRNLEDAMRRKLKEADEVPFKDFHERIVSALKMAHKRMIREGFVLKFEKIIEEAAKQDNAVGLAARQVKYEIAVNKEILRGGDEATLLLYRHDEVMKRLNDVKG